MRARGASSAADIAERIAGADGITTNKLGFALHVEIAGFRTVIMPKLDEVSARPPQAPGWMSAIVTA